MGIIKIALGIILALVLLVGGCTLAAIHYGPEAIDSLKGSAEKEIGKIKGEDKAISLDQFEERQIGQTQQELISVLGNYDSRGFRTFKGKKLKCIFYNELDAPIFRGKRFAFCFGNKNRLNKKFY